VKQFVYTAYLPYLKRKVGITELKFNRYKDLVKNITNNNPVIITNAFDTLVKDLCIGEEDINNLPFLDKLILLIIIRMVCISPDLELTATCPTSQKTFNFSVHLSDVINKLEAIEIPDDIYTTIKSYNNNELILELGMPSTLNIGDKDLNLLDTLIKKITIKGEDITDSKQQIIDHLPVFVLKDIKEYITYFNSCLQGINLLSVVSPYSNESIDIPLNFFSDSIIEFLKICYKRGLMSMYELEYFLIGKLRLDYELLKNSTPAELNIYINLFRDEKKEEEKARKKNDLNLPQMNNIY